MKKVLYVLAVVGLVILAVTLLRGLGKEKPILDPANQKTADSLETTRPAHERRLDSLDRAKHRADSLRMAVAERRKAARERSDISRARAAQEAQKAREARNATDSATHWRLAYHAERERGDSLEAALNHAEREREQAEIGRATADSAFEIEHSRRLALEELQKRIMSDIAKAEVGRARFLGLPLPTKGELLTGVVAGAVGYGLGKASG